MASGSCIDRVGFSLQHLPHAHLLAGTLRLGSEAIEGELGFALEFQIRAVPGRIQQPQKKANPPAANGQFRLAATTCECVGE
mmetsp:Transcript_16932/g.35408  ORF Transcript_16932/g.35408 Transcript_16932/m.35408 type:complete len:82 (-) Transcript_16932:865-1110(-)